MKQSIKISTIVFLTIIIASCSTDCKDNFVKEYNNTFGHYYGFEKRIVFDNHEIGKLFLYGSKNLDNAEDITLVFFSESYQLHFAEGYSPDTKLYIKFGIEIDTLRSKVYNMEKKGQYEETVSYQIPISTLQDILNKSKSVGAEMSLSKSAKITSAKVIYLWITKANDCDNRVFG